MAARKKRTTAEKAQIENERMAGRRALEQICEQYTLKAWVGRYRSFNHMMEVEYQIGPFPEHIDQYDMALEIGRELLRTGRYLDWMPK